MINLTRYKKFLRKLEKNQKTGLHIPVDQVRSDMYALPLIDVVHLYLRSRKIDNAILEPISLKRPELSRIELFKLIRKQNTDCAKMRDGVGGPLMRRLFKTHKGYDNLYDFLNVISDYNPLYHLKACNNATLRSFEQLYHQIVALDEQPDDLKLNECANIVSLAIHYFDETFSKVLDENSDLNVQYKIYYQGIKEILHKANLKKLNDYLGRSTTFDAFVTRSVTGHPYGEFSHPYIVDQRIIDELEAKGIEPIVIDGDIQQLYYHQVDAMSVTSHVDPLCWQT